MAGNRSGLAAAKGSGRRNPNADLARAVELRPDLVIGRTIGSGHFSPLEVPDQVNPMLERFLALYIPT